jgi:2-polyprenyl-3-methyl-5-hydroxy-6-metoxy-1,4-benzoquinol methylase
VAKDAVATLFETFTAYQRTEVLRAGIELGVFTAIATQAATADDLAARCRTAPRGMRILCDTLAALGFLTKSDGRYSLVAELQPFLDQSSPLYVGTVVNFVGSDTIMASFRDFTNAVRRGGTTVPDEGTLAPEHPIWVEFARSMAPLAAMTGQLIATLLNADEAPAWRVLDIAAGHGNFGISLALRNPHAEIVALDWANVLAVAEQNAKATGVADRFRKLAGSAFDVDFGGGYDLVLITHFLHHFDVPTCEKLLRKVYAALKPGGRTVTLEWAPNDDRVSPVEAATFAAVMLATTPAGDAYTGSELAAMCTNAGFEHNELHDLPVSTERVLISTK